MMASVSQSVISLFGSIIATGMKIKVSANSERLNLNAGHRTRCFVLRTHYIDDIREIPLRVYEF